MNKEEAKQNIEDYLSKEGIVDTGMVSKGYARELIDQLDTADEVLDKVIRSLENGAMGLHGSLDTFQDGTNNAVAILNSFKTKKEEKPDAIREHPLIDALDSRTRSHSGSIGGLQCEVGALNRRIASLEKINTLSRANSCGNCQGYYEGKVIFTTKEGTCRDCGRLVTATLKEQKKGKKKCPRKKSPRK